MARNAKTASRTQCARLPLSDSALTQASSSEGLLLTRATRTIQGEAYYKLQENTALIGALRPKIARSENRGPGYPSSAG